MRARREIIDPRRGGWSRPSRDESEVVGAQRPRGGEVDDDRVLVTVEVVEVDGIAADERLQLGEGVDQVATDVEALEADLVDAVLEIVDGVLVGGEAGAEAE